MLGCGASTMKDGPQVSSQVIGEGKTSQWSLAALDYATTACVLFEITADGKASDKAAPGGDAFYLQVRLPPTFADRRSPQRSLIGPTPALVRPRWFSCWVENGLMCLV